MSYQVETLPTAWRDLDGILAWIAQRSPRGAVGLRDAFEKQVEAL